MKRILLLLVSIGLVGVSLGTAEASRRAERSVQGSYGALPAPVTGCNEPLGSFACLVVQPRPTERFFTATVKDAHGQPVYVTVTSRGAQLTSFCGTTPTPVALVTGASLEFDIGVGRWPSVSACPARHVKTTGTITVTLSDQR